MIQNPLSSSLCGEIVRCHVPRFFWNTFTHLYSRVVLLVGKHGREKIPNGKLWPQNFLETQARIRTLGSGSESKKRVNGNAGSVLCLGAGQGKRAYYTEQDTRAGGGSKVERPLGVYGHFSIAASPCTLAPSACYNITALSSVHTCHNKKSLSRTSPEVLITKSGGGESPVYRHLSNTSSDISLEEQTHFCRH